MKIKYMAALLLISILTIGFLAGCDPEVESSSNIVKLEDIKNLPKDSIYIEWLGDKEFNVDNPTMIFIHGETPGAWDYKYELVLPEDDYIFYESSSLNYNITRNIEGLDRILYQYWLDLNYNLGVFHYEAFADDNMKNLSKKIFNSVDMTYLNEEGREYNDIPNYSLTEIMAAMYLDEIPEQAYGNEIRLVGNGIGANLALSLSDYLYTYYSKGEVRAEVLPHRTSLIDPYLSSDSFNHNMSWRDIDSEFGLLSMAEDMLEKTTAKGLVVDMVENVEVGAELVEGKSQETLTSPYDYEYSPAQTDVYRDIKTHVAYLQLRQKYSELFTDEYRALNRAGLDWYLYSVKGSDDTGVGYPTSKPDYTSSLCNWGPYNTRPFLNDRQRNNNSSRGKNYSVSAWTPTVWIRALKGIEFRMQRFSDFKEDDQGNTIKDKHGISLYEYEDYTLARYRSENYQRAINMDYTFVVGYIWNDKNQDRKMNEGIGSLLSNITVNATLTTSIDGKQEIVETASETTGQDGFFIFKFDRAFNNSHTLDLTVVPPNSSYHAQKEIMSTYHVYHVQDLTRHNFNFYTKKLTIASSYGNAITMANCGLVVK